MNKAEIQIAGEVTEVEYTDDGIEYELKVTYEDMETSIRIKTKTFPYIYWVNESNEIVYVRYLGKDSDIIAPFFDCYETNNYSACLYSYNPYIEKLTFQEGVTSI